MAGASLAAPPHSGQGPWASVMLGKDAGVQVVPEAQSACGGPRAVTVSVRHPALSAVPWGRQGDSWEGQV